MAPFCSISILPKTPFEEGFKKIQYNRYADDFVIGVIGSKKDAEKIFRVSGVYPHGMYSVYKLLRIKNSYRELYERAEKLMLIGDYIGYILTGNRGSDYASASRTGVLDIRKKEISFELCALFGIDEKLFSPVVRQG